MIKVKKECLWKLKVVIYAVLLPVKQYFGLQSSSFIFARFDNFDLACHAG
jgi:hypothetical protein